MFSSYLYDVKNIFKLAYKEKYEANNCTHNEILNTNLNMYVIS